MRKQRFRVNSLDNSVSDQVQGNFDDLNRFKIEQITHTTSLTQTAFKPNRETETGLKVFPGTASASMQIVIAYSKKYEEIFGIKLTPIATSLTLNVVDFTQSQMTIQIDATATLATASMKFFYEVTGSED